MKYSCDLIRDLLPLYCDSVCSEDSARAVREHLDTCETCRGLYDDMRQKTAVDSAEYQDQQAASMRAVRKKIKKRNTGWGIAGIVAGAVIAAFALQIILAGGAAAGITWLVMRQPGYVSDDTASYGEFRDYTVFSRLDIFPERVGAGMTPEAYHFYYKEGVLDPEAQLYFQCAYTPDGYQAELQRLNGIQAEYQGAVQSVRYDTQSFRYPAYVTVYSDNYCYEYALLLGDHRIAYLFLQFTREDEIAFPAEYLPNEFERGRVGFSIYVFRQKNGDGYCVY